MHQSRFGVFGVVSREPWWVGVSLAVACLVVGWGYAAHVHLPGSFRALEVLLHPALFYSSGCLAMAFVICAGLSYYRQGKREALLLNQRSLTMIRQMPWQDFERLVGAAYERLGWRVRQTGLGGADGGIDLIIKRSDETVLVQCKRWNSNVGAPVVREMFGLMAHHRASGVKIICAGKFSRDAVEFARGKPIELVDGPALMSLIGEIQAGNFKHDDSCPLCHSPMVKRYSRESGQMFFGCSRFPDCHGTRPMI